MFLRCTCSVPRGTILRSLLFFIYLLSPNSTMSIPTSTNHYMHYRAPALKALIYSHVKSFRTSYAFSSFTYHCYHVMKTQCMYCMECRRVSIFTHDKEIALGSSLKNYPILTGPVLTQGLL